MARVSAIQKQKKNNKQAFRDCKAQKTGYMLQGSVYKNIIQSNAKIFTILITKIRRVKTKVSVSFSLLFCCVIHVIADVCTYRKHSMTHVPKTQRLNRAHRQVLNVCNSTLNISNAIDLLEIIPLGFFPMSQTLI